MYICMHVCMYACMNVCMYECMYVCMYVCMYICMYVCMYVCMYLCCLMFTAEGSMHSRVTFEIFYFQIFVVAMETSCMEYKQWRKVYVET